VTAIDPGPATLEDLEARLARDFALLVIPPAKDWLEPRVHPTLGPALDVAVIGAGMSGLAASFALKCLAVRSLKMFDRSRSGFEGPWATFARMETLRSPPELSGPAFGFSNLTFRAWFEAQFGLAAWKTVRRIPRLQWMDYLRWYRTVIGVPAENETALIDIGGDSEFVILTLRSPAGTRKIAARRVVLASGRDGLGGPYTPEMFRGLDPRYVRHSVEDIDFDALKGKVVGVIGAGASAVDNAAEALEHGAARVAMMIRRPDMPRINKGMGIGSAGFWVGFHDLTDRQKWSIVNYIDEQAVPAPHDSTLRVSRHGNFSLFANCSPLAVEIEDGRVLLATTRGKLAFDFLILATGLTVDWSQRPELAALKPHIRLWGDHFMPQDRSEFAQADHPVVGPSFEFLERTPGAAPWVERIHCFTFSAYMSHGPVSGDIPAISTGAERLANGVAAKLFAEDYERTWARMVGWSNPELTGDEYTLSEDVTPFLADQRADVKT
jgi:cation diffusion facilitator CzcD-associated flavoprotein CzcO